MTVQSDSFQEYLAEEIKKYGGVRYRISLHIDDETIVCTSGRQYGYNVYQLNAHDDDWKDKIIERAMQIRKREKHR